MSLILEGFALAIEGAALVIDCACCIKELHALLTMIAMKLRCNRERSVFVEVTNAQAILHVSMTMTVQTDSFVLTEGAYLPAVVRSVREMRIAQRGVSA